jgi:hypothetical protein
MSLKVPKLIIDCELRFEGFRIGGSRQYAVKLQLANGK